MANIKTHYRELSFAIKLHELISKIPLNGNIFNNRIFYNECVNRIKGNIQLAQNILEEPINKDHVAIINNGFQLACAIYYSSNFIFNTNDYIAWVGNNSFKSDPIDIIAGSYGFSLKEESYILENMGLYKLINILTGIKLKRGIHVFNDFATKEYNDWFHITWSMLLKYLNEQNYKYQNPKYTSSIYTDNNQIIMEIMFLDKYLQRTILPKQNLQWLDFMKATNSIIREKVFSKWISSICENDTSYLQAKKKCSEVAGKHVVDFIKNNINYENISRFLQIYKNEYYYAKTTSKKIEVYKIPSFDNFNSIYTIEDISFNVPLSQLNIITKIKNKQTEKILIFRNECRFSHGQFNGTPEAKMYYDRNTDLSILYMLIIDSEI